MEDSRQRLLAREKELIEEISRFESQVRESPSGKVGDPADHAVSSEGKDLALAETSLATEALNQVRAALKRIENGTYGNCIECGERIEPARLEAVPWTPYCLKDQELHDRAASNPVKVSSTI